MGLESDNCGYGFASLAMNLYLKNLNEIIKKLNQVINLNLKTNHNLINQKKIIIITRNMSKTRLSEVPIANNNCIESFLTGDTS